MKQSSLLTMILSAAFTLTSPLNGQKTFNGPVAGYVFDAPNHAIRPVLGRPGAASLGSPTATSWDVASISPNGKMALGVQGQIVNLIPDLTAPDLFGSLDNAIAAERIKWSADSTAAVLYSSSLHLIQRITGMRGIPAVHAAVDLSSLGAVTGWSVSADGRSVALSSGASGAASVYLMTDDATPVAIGSLADPGASAFAADGSSVFVLDRSAQAIVRLQLPSGTAQGSLDASSISGIGDLAASPDGALLYVSGQQSISAFDLTTWQPMWSQTVETTAASIKTLSISPPVFLLNYPRQDGSPVWLLDGRSAQVYFVPSGKAAANAY